MTFLSLVAYELRCWARRRVCSRYGHPGTRGDYPPLCTRCGRWVR